MAYHLAPICIISTKGIFYEYLDWKLIPSGIERCKIILNTKCNKLNIEIEIIGSQCKLLITDNQKIPEINIFIINYFNHNN